MKRILILLLICLCLSGCASVNSATLKEDVEKTLSNFNNINSLHANNTLTYFSYYLPSDMQEIECNDNYSLVGYNDAKIIVNLNIASIISSKYFKYSQNDDGFFNNEHLFLTKSDNYSNIFGQNKEYKISIYNYEKEFIVYLVNSDAVLYGYCDEYDLVELVRHMIVISKSIDVDRNRVIDNYSSKDIVNYQKEPLNLFNVIIPTEGTLEELVEISNINNSNSK